MQGARVRVNESRRAHPTLWGAEGRVLWHCLKDIIVMVIFDKVVPNAPKGAYGVRFHSVAVDALEVIDERT
jgi:hypothetical protein